MISPASDADCPALARLHVECWQAAYRDLLPAEYLAGLSIERREAAWREVLAKGDIELLVWRGGNELLGLVSFGPSRDGDLPANTGEIWAIYVASTAWSRGIGKALWLEAEARMKSRGLTRCSLWVLVGNRRAIRFYEKAGFLQDVATVKKFELGGHALEEARYLRGVGSP